MCFIIPQCEHFPAILVAKMALGFDSSIKHIFFFKIRDTLFFFSHLMLYLISLILIFTTKNECMSTFPWCLVLGVVSRCSHKRALFPQQWDVGIKPTKPVSLRHPVATDTEQRNGSLMLFLLIHQNVYEAREIDLTILACPQTPENPLYVQLREHRRCM